MRFLFVDRILKLLPGGSVRGIKHITPDDVYLCSNDKGRPYFIPSLIGETLGQLAAWNVMVSNDFTLRPVAGVVARARLHRPAYIGETLLLDAVIETLDDQAVQYYGVAHVGKEVIFTIDGAIGPLLPMATFIEEQEVRRQFAEINRPGEWLPDEITEGKTKLPLLTKLVMPTPPSMFFDRILSSEPGLSLSAEKHISRTAPYFADHFPNKPVLPLTVLLECKRNLAYEFVAQASFTPSYQISEIRKIKMNDFVYPGDIVVCHVKIKQHDAHQLILSYRSEVAGKRVCVLDIVMLAQGDSR
jgi:3-hydroxymyristoyl/3-hydroxydecanoyl-(acyl carrier protein) dehydratase